MYRSAAYELGLAATAFLGGVTVVLLGWRYGRSLRRSSIRTRAHAEAARITGRRVDGGNAAFVLDARRPAAYCVPGRPPTIVLTTGALAVLDPEQLAAVLAHERAHLAGRHHLLLTVTRSLAAVAPVVPLFACGASAVARLAEMRADDVAARRAGGEQGRRTLLAALLVWAMEPRSPRGRGVAGRHWRCGRGPRPAARRPAGAYAVAVPRTGAGLAHARVRRRLRARAILAVAGI